MNNYNCAGLSVAAAPVAQTQQNIKATSGPSQEGGITETISMVTKRTIEPMYLKLQVHLTILIVLPKSDTKGLFHGQSQF